MTFPFCVVMAREGQITLPLAPKPGYVAAFSSVEKAAAFMFARGDTNWHMTLVTRPTLAGVVENLSLLGVKGFCLDPLKDVYDNLLEFSQIELS